MSFLVSLHVLLKAKHHLARRQPYMPKELHCCLATGSFDVAYCILCLTVVTTLKVYFHKGLHHLSWKKRLFKPASSSQRVLESSYVLLYEGWNFNIGNYLFTTDTK